MMKNQDFIASFMVFLVKQSLGLVRKVSENIHFKTWSVKIVSFSSKKVCESQKKNVSKVYKP